MVVLRTCNGVLCEPSSSIVTVVGDFGKELGQTTKSTAIISVALGRH
jgi:hypothetical protein